jgi:hypothetical protein
MKWSVKKKAVSHPRYGDKRDLCKFTLFPKRIGEHWVWLERYYELQEYRYNGITTFRTGDMGSHSHDGWVTVKVYQVKIKTK